jgi:hypothetical protein
MSRWTSALAVFVAVGGTAQGQALDEKVLVSIGRFEAIKQYEDLSVRSGYLLNSTNPKMLCVANL